MLIPRFSLKWLLIVMTGCGVVAFVLAEAVQGRSWSIAVSVTLAAFVAMALVHAGVFLVAWAFASMGRAVRSPQAASPFATHTPPPQLLRPSDDS